MKKLGLLFLILIFACTSVFAVEKFLNLKTEIESGSNPPGPDNPGVNPGDNENGLYYLIGLAAEDRVLEVGSPVVDGDLKTIEYPVTDPYTDKSFLFSENEDPYELDIFLAIGTNISKTNKLYVSFSTTNGWVREDKPETTYVPIYFKSSVQRQSSESSNLYATSTATGDNAISEKIEVTAIGPSNSDYIYLAKTTAFWARSKDYLAGIYTAVIKVDISAN